jgi:ElaB/YqjD/DUF883 family membrane-anchored ribosome-binding protein
MVNAPSSPSKAASGEAAPQAGNCPPDCDLPENSKENLDAKLDHAIEETFPTSDPVSVSITKGSAIDYDQEGRPAGSGSQGREEPAMAGDLLGQAQSKLREVAESVSGLAQDAYDQSQHYMRRAGERYPEVQRLYQQGSRTVSDRVTESPWLAILAAGAAGYLLAWLIHGGSRDRTGRVPDYARTGRAYTASRR